MKKLGLLGKNIGYSFSRNYFTEKFKSENLDSQYSYQNFDISSISEFKNILKDNPELIGLNVTIPYKEEVIALIDELSETSKKIGAINTIKITQNGKLIGHNTDYIGFKNSLQPLLQSQHQKALILGTGGAAKAIIYTLNELGIQHQLVSREKTKNTITYEELNEEIFNEYYIVINCTPLGTYPNIEKAPNIPYQYFSGNHLAYDLIYNPEKTTFLSKAETMGATIKNGHEMLKIQAEEAWKIWTIEN